MSTFEVRGRSPSRFVEKNIAFDSAFIPHNGKYLAMLYVSENNSAGKWGKSDLWWGLLYLLAINHAFFLST